MNNIYICGDSFAVPDVDYGLCWVDMLPDVTNLAQVCATNLLISQQVDYAIKNQAKFIICLCTSSTRQLVKFGTTVVPISWHSIDTTKFNNSQKQLLKKYAVEFFDLATAIYENQCIIENTLSKLESSGISYLFDQGGFEHRSKKQYFQKYQHRRSQINLWDYTKSRPFRPYYHITNNDVHKQVAEYYINEFRKI